MAALLLWALVTSFLRLGAAPVYVVNEAREGVYARAMLASGNFVLPEVPNHVENGEIIADKPPLVHWLSAGVTALRAWVADGRLPAGPELAARYDEWSLRFPSAAAAVVTVAGIALLGHPLVGRRAALLAGATLLASSQFVHQARFGRVDMTLCCCVTLAMLLVGRALLDGRGSALVLAAVAAALAVLAKGPLGVALPVAGSAAFVLGQLLGGQSLARWRHLPWTRAVIVWALLALPWYAVSFAAGGMAVVRSQILSETLEQFMGENSRMPFLYYLRPWLLDAAPWNLLALAGAWRAWRARDSRAGFCVAWWACFLVVFQLSAYKRRAYLLPALPAGALLAGYWMDRWLADQEVSLRSSVAAAVGTRWRWAIVTSLAAAVVGSVAARGAAVERWVGSSLPPVDAALAAGGAMVGAFALLGLGRALLRRQLPAAFAAACIAQAVVLLGPVATAERAIAAMHSPVPLVRRLVGDLPDGRGVTALGLGDDPSLLVLFYFPDLTRIRVVAQRDGVPPALPDGYYLVARNVWARLDPSGVGEGGASGDPAWRVLWTDTLWERGTTVPLVFAERRVGGSGSNPSVEAAGSQPVACRIQNG